MTARTALIALSLFAPLALVACPSGVDDPDVGDTPWTYAIVDTDQVACYDASSEADCPADGEAFAGQDGQHVRYAPSYTDNGDGTVTDDVTGLTWEQAQNDDVQYDDAAPYCDALELGGHTDWRLPTIKEGYSLILFDGATGSGAPDSSSAPADAVPYIDDTVFDFAYGSPRFIDVQFATTSVYVSNAFASNDGTAAGEECFFGVNHADGRIKCYPTSATQSWQVRCVRGNAEYGVNDLTDDGDGTVSDAATGLMWEQADSGDAAGMDWESALAWCADADTGGYDDWRLPDAKELHSIVDYSRSPDTTDSAAIDPVFDSTPIVDEAGDANYGWYWSGTTHLDGMQPGTDAVYVAFGEALGYWQNAFLDVHGAGAQRGDPKSGSASDFPQWGMGPQGDVRRVFNLARCVRDRS